ncbi:baseplate J/gp47 family protein [Erwinia sp. HDF1-3R]|uniref:baseplate J/gp47 family protein n=1 Tax=Erwinia sp. HDF1-3R TaxID=3141543 RepID=UPI0031F55AC4
MALNLSTLGLSATITAQGIAAPGYQAILSTLTGYFQQIYGSDAYLEPDSKDGQMLAIVALAIHDTNNAAVSCYNSFSPTTAQGDALTRNVKINGISRKGAINSTVDLTLVGSAGTLINNGSVKDSNNIVWNLPASVTIDINGSVTVTATCTSTGPVMAAIGSVTEINTPTRGWKSVINLTAAAMGTAAETDAELRQRQAQSVALTSLSTFDALDGAISNIDGVTAHKIYQNDTNDVDANGLPAHSISAIVVGGSAPIIAEVIRGKKSLGVATYGNTSLIVKDSYGTPQNIRFSRPVSVPIHIEIEFKALAGYTNSVAVDVKSAVSNYINNLGIGGDILLSRLYSPANLTSGEDNSNSQFYDVVSLKLGKSESSLATNNIVIAYDEFASCIIDDIKIKVVP